MLSCKQTAEMISRGLDEKLPLLARLNLRLHLLMCRACTAYRAQVEGLQAALKRRLGGGGRGPERMPDETRGRIREALRRSRGGKAPGPGDPESP